MKKKSKNHYSLLELSVVLLGLTFSLILVLPKLIETKEDAKKSAHRAERQSINAQLEVYFYTHSAFPVEGRLDQWKDNPEDYFISGVPSTCTLLSPWIVKNGRIDTTSHEGHE